MKLSTIFGKAVNGTKYEPLKEPFREPDPSTPAELKSLSEKPSSSKSLSTLHQRLVCLFGKTMLFALVLVGSTNLILRARSTIWPAKLPSCICASTHEASMAMDASSIQ